MRHASLLQTVAIGIATLQPFGTQICAQTAVQTEALPVEWTFDEVVRTAIAQHPLVGAARDRIAAAGGARRTAASFSNPIATYWIEHGAFPGPSAPFGSGREASTYVTLPLEPFFQRAPRIRRADADVKGAEIALLAVRRQVALDAAHAFYKVALAQVSRQVAEEKRVGLERLVSYNRSRVTEGAAAELELIRVQVELDRSATEVALAEIELVKSRAELWPFLHAETPSATATMWRVAVPSVDATRRTLAPLTSFATRARAQRPEVLGAAARVSAATAETAVQRALTVRQVGATFGFKRVEGGNSMIAGISMPVPLFDRNRGELQRATAELAAAEHELAWSERAVAAEIEGAYTAVRGLSAQVSMMKDSFLDRADEANRITLGAYQEGGATLLQVLDAARGAADARLMYYRVVLAGRQSVFDLAVAAGDEPEAALSALAALDGLSARTFGPGGDRGR